MLAVQQDRFADGFVDSFIDNSIDSDDDGHQAFNDIEAAVKQGTLTLPMMPQMAEHLSQVFANEQYDILRIAEQVQTDIGVAAAVLKTANSPADRGPLPIRTAKHAVCRLGQKAVQGLVLRCIKNSYLAKPSPEIESLLQDHWQKALSIAKIAAELTSHSNQFDPDEVFMAALFQDVGVLALIAWMQEKRPQQKNPRALLAELKSAHATNLSELILRSWHLSEDIIAVAAASEDWVRQSGADTDIADILTVARYHYYVGKGAQGVFSNTARIPAYQKLIVNQQSPKDSQALYQQAQDYRQVITGI